MLPSYGFNCLIGLILSDLHVARRSPTGNSRLAFTQTAKLYHRGFFELVFAMLSPFCTPGLIPYIREFIDKRTGVLYSSISFVTMQLPIFNKLHDLFYKRVVNPVTGAIRYIKIVPKNIAELLTIEGLAFWIMGDGSVQNVNGLHLSIYAFTAEECKLLVDALTTKWGLNCSVHNTKSGPRIYIDAESMSTIRELLKPHMHPDMYHKIGC